MDTYKKLIKNQETRMKILELITWVPDSIMIRLQYFIKLKRVLHLKNPKRYTEKLQWYKLYYRDPLLTKCADKYLVRDYVKSKGLGHILNELYGVYDSVEDIDFTKLPKRFVIKLNNGSGTNILVDDKDRLNFTETKETLRNWLTRKNISAGREWCYHDISPKIIIEKYLDMDENNDLPDFKFFCFNGKIFCLYTMINYIRDHRKGKLAFYDINFNKLPYRRKDYG